MISSLNLKKLYFPIFSYYKVKLTLESEEMENINTAWNFLEEQLPKGKHFFFQTSQAVPFGWFPFKGNERSQNRFNMPHFMPMDSNCIDMEIMSTLGITKNA